MAVVLSSPATYAATAMSHRRNPLSTLPNAANSPYRAVTAAATKRSRGDAGLQEDSVYDAQPPAKRQTSGSKGSNFCTPPRKPQLQSGDDGLFGKKAPNRKPTTFDRKLLAARQPQKTARQGKPPKEATRDIEAWQRHYRKVFPLFVFYFENVPEDARMGCSRGIRSLGAVSDSILPSANLANSRVRHTANMIV